MSTKCLNVHEIKANFSKYAREVLRGKSFVIAIRNKPFAELKPLAEEAPKRDSKLVFGLLKGKFEVPEDFNAPLNEFEKDFYGRN